MTTLLTWDDVRARSARDDANKHDHWIPGPDLSFDGGELVFRDCRMGFSDHALQQMCQRLDVPFKWAAKVRARTPGTFDDAMAEGLRHIVGNNQHLLRSRAYGDDPRRGSLRACLSGDYAVFNNSDFLEIVAGILDGPLRGRHSFRSFDLCETSMYTKVLFDDLRCWDPVAKSTELKVGMVFANSEVGLRRLSCWPFVYRKACTNDLSVVDEGALEQRHIHLERSELQRRVQHAVNKGLEQGDALLQRLVDSHRFKVEDPLKVLERVLAKRKLAKPVVDAAKAAFMVEPVYTRFGVVNAITAAAQTREIDERINLEAVAGDYLLNAA